MRNTRQRRQQILQLLVQHGTVQVADLVERFDVSSVTIRADLSQIESQGLATRTHGGATLLRTPPLEQDIRQKDTLNLPLKEAIGAQAARLVKPGDNIIIDSGSTTMTLARHLRGHRDVTVMTNGLNIAWELANAPGVNLLLTGGQLRKESLSFQGSQAEASLMSYSFDTLFLGVDGLDLQFGLTTHNEGEASLNHRMVERARKIVVLTDASKFGLVGLHRIARLDQVHAVITDDGISNEYRDGLQRLNIETIVAGSQA
jgi:DeoR family transcriptional regulator of aga operon